MARTGEIRILDDAREPFFSVKSLAAYLSLSERTVRELIADGEIESCLMRGQRRIDSREVDRYIERCRMKGRTR